LTSEYLREEIVHGAATLDEESEYDQGQDQIDRPKRPILLLPDDLSITDKSPTAKHPSVSGLERFPQGPQILLTERIIDSDFGWFVAHRFCLLPADFWLIHRFCLLPADF
jgi:hypothetical protein